jgi:hypothetical protein
VSDLLPGKAQAFGLRALAPALAESQAASHWEVRIMTRSLLWWLRGTVRRKSAQHCRWRREFRPTIDGLEERVVPTYTLSLAPSEPAPQLVGEPILWTATASGDCGSDLVYQFSVKLAGEQFHVARDFSAVNTFTWAPMEEGNYRIRVIAKEGYDATNTVHAVVSDVVDSRVTGHQAVITATANPLVALFSVPPGPSGMVHVEFSVAGPQPDWRSTNELPRLPDKSTNFFVAGMLPDTTYEMRYVVTGHHHEHHSVPMQFTTGTIPASAVFPSRTVLVPPGPGSDLDQDMLFQMRTSAPANASYFYATDLSGQITWYYADSQAGFTHTVLAPGASLVPGGTVLVTGADSAAPRLYSINILREIDLAGNPLRETNLAAVNSQLSALGHNIIYGFSHDVQRLPNGNTAVLGLTERTVDIDGTVTNYIGDMVVVLDQDLQVSWAWDAFDYLDVHRGPVLGEITQPGAMDPSAAVPNLPAVDWLHANAISWSPADQNLVLSLRHQDWVIKVDYENGAGDGHILWRLGQDGDFTVNASDPTPWFSHQHDAHFIDDTTLIVFDNGNTRRASDPNADSRGQVWTLDESTQTATLAFNVDLGNYSDRVGSAQALSNGNYCFTSGFVAPNFVGQSIEVLPDGTQTYVLQLSVSLYRSFRVSTLYAGVTDQVDDGGGPPRPGGHTGDGLGAAVATAQPASPGGLQEVPGLNSAVAAGTSIAPNASPMARIAPLAAPPLLDWVFAHPTREELGGAALEVPLVIPRAQRPDPWQLLISDLDLLQYTPQALLTRR